MSYDNNQQQQGQKQYPKGFMDFPKLGLRTKNRNGDYARLLFGTRNSKPVITLMTGNRDEDRKGIVNVTLDHDNFGAFRMVFAKALTFVPTEDQPEFKNSVQTFRNNGRPQPGQRPDRVPDARIAIGRNREGELWLGVFKEGHEDIQFLFRADPNFKWYVGNGQEMPKGVVSEMYAGGWLENLNTYMPMHVEKFFEEAHLNTQRPGGNSGQGNGQRYGNSGSRNGGSYDRNGGGYNRGGGGGSYDRSGSDNTRSSDTPSPKSDEYNDGLPF